MNRNDGAGVRGDLALEVSGVQSERFVYLGYDRHRAGRQHSGGGRDVGVSGHYHLVARADAHAGKGADQRAGARVDHQRVPSVQPLRGLFLESRGLALVFRIAEQVLASENGGDGIYLLVANDAGAGYSRRERLGHDRRAAVYRKSAVVHRSASFTCGDSVPDCTISAWRKHEGSGGNLRLWRGRSGCRKHRRTGWRPTLLCRRGAVRLSGERLVSRSRFEAGLRVVKVRRIVELYDRPPPAIEYEPRY